MKRNIFYLLVALALVLMFINKTNAQVAINTNGNPPANSAMLDIASTDRGVLIPRMTENEKNAISNPDEGLLLFQTDGAIGFYYYTAANGWQTIAGLTSLSVNDPLTSSGGSAPTIGLATPITVNKGGTGSINFATNGIIYGSGTNALTSVTTFCRNSSNVGISTSSPNSTLHINGSFATAYVSKSGLYTLGATDQVVNVTAATTITLPSASGITSRVYTIKNSSSGSVTVNTTSSQTIDGATSYSLSSQYKYVTVMSTGSNWIIIGNN